MIIPEFVFRINYFFLPKEKPSVYISLDDTQDSIRDGFRVLAKERYPNTFGDETEIAFWTTGQLLIKTFFVGNHLGIKAHYTIVPSLKIYDSKLGKDRFFELKEIT